MYKGIQGGAHTLGPGVYPGWAILAEGILTFLLVFTVLLTAVDEENSSLAPLAIGFAVAVDIIAGYSIVYECQGRGCWLSVWLVEFHFSSLSVIFH